MATVTATPDEDYATINLSVPVAGVDTVSIYRRSPSGRIIAVRGAYKADPQNDPFVVNDYEAPIGVPVTYYAVTTTGGADTTGPDTSAVVLHGEDTWLVDLWNPANSVKVVVEEVPASDYGVAESVLYPLMRRTPVVVQNVRRAAAGSMTVVTATEDEAKRVRLLFANGVPVLFQSPWQLGVGNLYFSASKVVEERASRYAGHEDRRWKVEWAEVDRPRPEWVLDLDALGLINYADAYAIYGQYGTIATDLATYEALRTTKKGEVGTVGGVVQRPDLTWRGD